jgi:signal transduction histidine kinase
VTIDLHVRDGALEFRVADQGTGFDPAVRSAGNGLTNLRDRLGALGGHAEVESAPGRGTTVSGQIPLP